MRVDKFAVLFAAVLLLKFISSENFINHHSEQNMSTRRPWRFEEDDLTTLSELPLEKLLKVKKSINDLRSSRAQAEVRDERVENRENFENQLFHPPGTMALVDEKKIVR